MMIMSSETSSVEQLRFLLNADAAREGGLASVRKFIELDLRYNGSDPRHMDGLCDLAYGACLADVVRAIQEVQELAVRCERLWEASAELEARMGEDDPAARYVPLVDGVEILGTVDGLWAALARRLEVLRDRYKKAQARITEASRTDP